MKVKEPVRLRKKRLNGENYSLYLDCYINGERSYEYLKLYLIPEITREDKERNRETLEIANAIKSKRILEIYSGAVGLPKKTKAEKTLFLDFFTNHYESLKIEDNTVSTWLYVETHIRSFDKREDITIDKINADWLKRFCNYLQTVRSTRSKESLKQSTIRLYLDKIKSCLLSAKRKGIIEKNPFDEFTYKVTDKHEREYLTIEEVKRLIDTPIKDTEFRRAFLFSCFTGLRISDIMKLRWGDVSDGDAYARITFTQKKTKQTEYLDINPQARELMGERHDARSFVFPKLTTGYTNRLRQWLSDAGIDKHISFHCARHTFAVMMLELDTDLYTVSKLLGHRNIATTQIYAKVVDKKKQEAVAKIPDLLHKKN